VKEIEECVETDNGIEVTKTSTDEKIMDHLKKT
jgi:hypothetical protein